MVQWVLTDRVDLSKDAQRQQVGAPEALMLPGDNEAHRWEITVLNNGEAADLAGASVAGYFLRSDGETVAVVGSVTGNVISVVLAQECYAFEGLMRAIVRVTLNGVITTVIQRLFRVQQDIGDQIIDPGEVIPDIDELLAQIAAMEAATAAANAAAAAVPSMIAPTFSTSTAYAAGDYVYYDGALYRFTADHTAGAWTGTDAAEAVIGQDVSELKSAIQHDIGFNENKFTFWGNYVVAVDTGTLYSNTKYIATKEPIAVAPGDTVKFVDLPEGRGNSSVVFYSSVTDMGGNLAGDSISIPSSVQSAEITVPANANYIRFTAGFTSATPASTVNPAEIYVNFSETTKEKISNLNSETQRLSNTLDELTSQIGSVENEDLFTEWENYVVATDSGTLYSNPQYIAVKKAIPVKGGDVIYLYNLPTNRSNMNIIFYTDVTEMGGTAHSYVIDFNNTVSSYECVVPQGANYFRVTIGFGSPTPASTVEDAVFFVNYHTTFKDEQNPELNVLVFGDSISDTQNITIDSTTNTTTSYKETYPNNYYEKDGLTVWYQMWPSLIRRALNIKELRNYAKSGAHFYTSESETDPRQKLLYQVQVAINDLPNPNGVFPTNSFNPDVVIVACGINDGSIQSGAFDSTMAKTVMKAGDVGVDVEATMAAMNQNDPMDAMRYVLMLLKQTFPTALLLYVNPLQQVYHSNAAHLTAREELGKMAEQYDFINLDGFGQFGVVRDFETQEQVGLLTKDGLHPNDKGQNLYARNIAQAIRRYYLPLDKFNP